MELTKYQLGRIEEIQKKYAYDFVPVPMEGMKLANVWTRNYKDKIKVNIYYELSKIQTDFDTINNKAHYECGNLYAEMDEDQAVALYKDLEKTLKRRGVVL